MVLDDRYYFLKKKETLLNIGFVIQGIGDCFIL